MTYDPWAELAARPHIVFGITRLPLGHGWWLPDVPGIVLDDRLGRVERRAALAHELVHAEYGDDQCAANGAGTARIARRREREADRIAAERLIDLDALADALRWALSCAEVAEELDVTEHLARTRIRGLTAADKAYIEQRIDARWIA